LEHHGDFGAAGEDGGVCGGKGGAGIEGEVEVVEELRGPAGVAGFDFGVGAFLRGHHHLREEEIAFDGADGVVACERATGIETPVPEGEDEDVGDPQGAGGAEESLGGFAVFGEAFDEE